MVLIVSFFWLAMVTYRWNRFFFRNTVVNEHGSVSNYSSKMPDSKDQRQFR